MKQKEIHLLRHLCETILDEIDEIQIDTLKLSGTTQIFEIILVVDLVVHYI